MGLIFADVCTHAHNVLYIRAYFAGLILDLLQIISSYTVIIFMLDMLISVNKELPNSIPLSRHNIYIMIILY